MKQRIFVSVWKSSAMFFFFTGYSTEDLQLTWVNGHALDLAEFTNITVFDSFGLCYSEDRLSANESFGVFCCDIFRPQMHQALCKVTSKFRPYCRFAI